MSSIYVASRSIRQVDVLLPCHVGFWALRLLLVFIILFHVYRGRHIRERQNWLENFVSWLSRIEPTRFGLRLEVTVQSFVYSGELQLFSAACDQLNWRLRAFSHLFGSHLADPHSILKILFFVVWDMELLVKISVLRDEQVSIPLNENIVELLVNQQRIVYL